MAIDHTRPAQLTGSKSKMGKQNTIALNGKLFDVITGLPIGKIVDKSMHPIGKPKFIDGVTRVTPPDQPVTSTNKKIEPTTREQLSHVSQEVHRRREHAKTLMRSSVAKPESSRLQAVASRLDTHNKSTSFDPGPANLAQKVAAKRRQRAEQISKSKHISRFHNLQPEPTVYKKTAVLSVKDAPSHPESHHHSAVATPSTSSPTNDLFTNALGRANAHEQKLDRPMHGSYNSNGKPRAGGKIAKFGATGLVIVLLGGFIAYQNLTNMALHAAVNKAGIHASLPGYHPSGFAISRQIIASPGQIVIDVRSNSDDRHFSITQTASSWNSQTLLNDYVATTDQSYQQHNQSNGKTVYTFGDANATWVDGGIWYKIEGNSTLNTDQLLKIANSF